MPSSPRPVGDPGDPRVQTAGFWCRRECGGWAWRCRPARFTVSSFSRAVLGGGFCHHRLETVQYLLNKQPRILLLHRPCRLCSRFCMGGRGQRRTPPGVDTHRVFRQPGLPSARHRPGAAAGSVASRRTVSHCQRTCLRAAGTHFLLAFVTCLMLILIVATYFPPRKSEPREGSRRGGKEHQAAEKPLCLEKGKKPKTGEVGGPRLLNFRPPGPLHFSRTRPGSASVIHAGHWHSESVDASAGAWAGYPPPPIHGVPRGTSTWHSRPGTICHGLSHHSAR